MSVGRRDFIMGTLGAAAASGLLSGCSSSDEKASISDGGVGDGGVTGQGPGTLVFNGTLFQHGVASGDPLHDRVILWTRLSLEGGAPAEVSWVVTSDPSLLQVVQTGSAQVSAERDGTVKVDVAGLAPATTYYYAFYTLERGRSVIGRTRTLPLSVSRARIAFTSCANYQNGFFSAYRAIARREDLDLWVHLGDYIYEYANGVYADPALATERALLPANETTTLADYRARYALYRRDRDLQEVHRQHPLVAVWDDHEFANNAYLDDAENHTSDAEAAATGTPSEGDWNGRKRAAAQAFLEWLPIREQAPNGGPVPNIYRTFSFGELFDLIMLDTRMLARAKQAGGDMGLGQDVGTPEVWTDPQRQLLGSAQESWFLAELTRSRERGAAWRLIGNQVIFAQTRSPLPPMGILFSDFWDGYQPARQRVIDHIVGNGIRNVVFLTGDIHSSFALEVNQDPFSATPPAPFAVELVGPSVTSLAFEGSPLADNIVPLLRGANPHVRYGEVTRKGYVLVDVTPERLQAEWYFVLHKVSGSDAEELGFSATCSRDSALLVPTTVPSSPKEGPAPAPAA